MLHGIHQRAISQEAQEVLMKFIHNIFSQITLQKWLPHLPVANELKESSASCELGEAPSCCWGAEQPSPSLWLSCVLQHTHSVAMLGCEPLMRDPPSTSNQPPTHVPNTCFVSPQYSTARNTSHMSNTSRILPWKILDILRKVSTGIVYGLT